MVDTHLANIGHHVAETTAQFHEGAKAAFEPVAQALTFLSGEKQNSTIRAGEHPTVGVPFPDTFDVATDGLNLGYGFLNGAVDVFPTESLPNYCRTNTSNSYWQVMNVFVKNEYNFRQEADLLAFFLGI